ncbi:hypothetical protein KAR91_18025 [Candidatus Pacearchaeota archaeon]|nr:hypothetical protein [Candidatus Pacearchaeota archaeon]
MEAYKIRNSIQEKEVEVSVHLDKKVKCSDASFKKNMLHLRKLFIEKDKLESLLIVKSVGE